MIRLGILGATGLVGREVLRELERLKIGIRSLKLFATSLSEGRRVKFKGKYHAIVLYLVHF